MAEQLHPETHAVHGGRPAHNAGAPINTPLNLSTTFVAGDPTHGYVREGSDTVMAFETALGLLEGGQTIAFSSGIATLNAVIDLLPAHARVIAPNHAYPGTNVRLRELAAVDRIDLVEICMTDTAALVEASATAQLVWLESPTNPLMEVADIRAVVQAAHQHGAWVAVDNTFMSPARQRPLELGADFSMHSATKSISGHSDALIGTLSVRDAELAQQLKLRRTLQGSVPGTLESYLALRGLRTLHLRVDRAEHNALELARRLSTHAAIERVLYTGLASDPGHQLHFSQASGGSTIVCAVVSATVEAVDAMCDSLTVWTHATSLGGVESTLERRRRWAAESLDTPETLVRFSVGIEHIEDLWADLVQALDRI